VLREEVKVVAGTLVSVSVDVGNQLECTVCRMEDFNDVWSARQWEKKLARSKQEKADGSERGVGQGTNICSSRVDTIKIGKCIGKRNIVQILRAMPHSERTIHHWPDLKNRNPRHSLPSFPPSPPAGAHFM
jgi:hypothetical protein